MVKKTIETISLDGGSLCLDFINTINDRFVVDPLDYLGSGQDLVKWAYRLKITENDTHKKLLKYIDIHPQAASEFLQQAKSIRELIYKIFLSISHNNEIQKEHLVTFNKIIPDYFSKLQIEVKDGSTIESWDYKQEDLHRILAPVLKDAYTLLLEGNRDRIRECPKCGWLFFDKSKNGRRRWCSMQTCGSNVKSLEYYRRKKQENRS